MTDRPGYSGFTSMRLPDAVKIPAMRYARALGVSLNALIAIALAEYLRSRVVNGGSVDGC